MLHPVLHLRLFSLLLVVQRTRQHAHIRSVYDTLGEHKHKHCEFVVVVTESQLQQQQTRYRNNIVQTDI